MTAPVRTVWRCAACGSEKVERDHLAPMGQYATGYCNDENGRKRPLITGDHDTVESLVTKNAERHRLKKLNGQIARGTMASHVYVKGQRPEGASQRSAPPCASGVMGKSCHWNKASHPSEADLKELRWT